jgi:thiol-disulfide isomerase/thioredoxin
VKSVDPGVVALTREHPPSDYTRIRFELGLEVPDFGFVDFEGRTRRLSEFRGKYLMLEFWGTWCSGCISDMPGLVEVYKDYRGRGFEILGMDDELTLRSVPPKNPDQMTAKAKALVAEKGVTWPQVRTETAEAISRRFRIGVHPTYILLDPMGRIVSWEGGGQPTLRGPKLRDTLERLLGPTGRDRNLLSQ